MAIQMRRGNAADFDPNKLVPGEWAVSMDDEAIYICVSQGRVIKVPTFIPAGQYVEDAEAWARGTRDGEPVDSYDPTYHNNSKYYSEIAEEASLNPPYIGANGNWYVWDTTNEEYVDSGVDASITVTIADVTTLAPDAEPYITNTGTSTDPIFHLFVPRGLTGQNGQDGQDGTDGQDGYSPVVTVTNITGGHRVNITDKTHPSGQNFDVMDGTGSGDMQAAVYDANSAVATAGGIASYVAGQLSDKYSTNDTAETTLSDADTFPFYDASSSAKRKTLWSNIKSVLKTYFDGIYSTFSGNYNDLTNKPTVDQTYSSSSTNAQSGTAVAGALDGWTTTATVNSSGVVTFTGLNDSYGYKLCCENKQLFIQSMTKTGSGTSVSLSFTVTGDSVSGAVCKLRIYK